MTEPGAAITLKDVFTMVTKLVGHTEAIDQRNLMADQIHRDHEERIRALERWRYALPASFMLAASSAAAAVTEIALHH